MSDSNMWPLAPEPAPAPTPAPTSMLRPPPRQQPAMEEPMDWNPEPEAPAPLIPPRRQETRHEPRLEPRAEVRAETRSEPRSEMRIDPRADMRMEPSPDSLPADPLAGLAAELARVHADPPAKGRPSREASREREVPREPPRARGSDRPPERLRPVPPAAAADEPTAPKSADQNLAEMAQRLEAALRRPKPQADQPRASDAPPSRPAKMVAPSESMREPEAMPMMAEPVAANEDAPPIPQAPTRAAAMKPAPQKSVYDSLEQEMASLLGRPNSKA
jgi:hypothetical protein